MLLDAFPFSQEDNQNFAMSPFPTLTAVEAWNRDLCLFYRMG
jgi:hypothetical protein